MIITRKRFFEVAGVPEAPKSKNPMPDDTSGSANLDQDSTGEQDQKSDPKSEQVDFAYSSLSLLLTSVLGALREKSGDEVSAKGELKQWLDNYCSQQLGNSESDTSDEDVSPQEPEQEDTTE